MSFVIVSANSAQLHELYTFVDAVQTQTLEFPII